MSRNDLSTRGNARDETSERQPLPYHHSYDKSPSEPRRQTVTAALRASPWRNRVRHNEFTGKMEIEVAGEWRRLNDNHLAHIATTLDGAEFSLPQLHTALRVTAQSASHHPVQHYCNDLGWDETPRAEHLFSRYFRAAPPPSDHPAVIKAHREYLAILSRHFFDDDGHPRLRTRLSPPRHSQIANHR